MSRLIKIVTLFTVPLLLIKCSQGFNSTEEMYKWMKDPVNGMIITKLSGDKELTMKFLPVNYLVYKEIKENQNRSDKQIDSLRQLYANSRSFLLTIKYKNDEPYDPVYEGIYSYDELNIRKQDMHFAFDEYVKLVSTDGGEYKPILSHMEETYGLQKHRNIHLVFSPENKNQMDILEAKELDIVFDDRIFNTGIHHFVFEKQNIDKKLKLSFLQ